MYHSSFRRMIETAALLMLACTTQAKEGRLIYPETRRVDQIDTYHGIEVQDPYRWLEEDARNSQDVTEWIEAENDLTREYFSAIPQRKKIADRLTELWNYERYSVPSQTAGKYFFRKNDGLQDQSLLYVAYSYADAGRVLIDPNTWSEDGTVSLGATKVSDDGRYLAYCRRDAGSDWSTVYVLEIESGRQTSDQLLWARWGNIVWNAESSGFYYTRYAEPEKGKQYQAQTINPMIYFHRLGTVQAEDELVYRRPDHPTWSFWLEQTDDDRYLVLSISRSTDPQNQVWFRAADAPLDSNWNPLVDDFDNQFWCLGNVDDRLYFFTDYQAPTKRVVAMDVNRPGRQHLTEIVPSSAATLVGVALLANKIVANYMKDVVSQVQTFSLQGAPLGEIKLPGIGSADGFVGRQTDTETFFLFTSYITPTSIYHYDLSSGRTKQIRAPRIDFESSQYESKQDFFNSKDGTKVPIIVTHRRGLHRDGQRPTLLYGYGGFNIPLKPSFSVEYANWMEMGGVVAVPNLRGGGEYGEQWHQAGKNLNKQNVFDDFIAAANWLIDKKYTSSEKLAIRGGSNGGLLVGAVMTQRPELFAACLPAVGVMDMLRYQEFTAGHFWRDEFGTVDDPDEFQVLLAYSPYHNIRPGTKYPATMITTADTDDRVVPMHSFKFGAALQAAQAGPAPILLRIETRAGHGAGTPISKRIDQAADRWAFLWKTLGMGEDQP